MTADWDLENETQRIRDDNNYSDAKIAAKLVLSGYDRDAAVDKVKNVNASRVEYWNDPGVHIQGDEEQPSEWTLSCCRFPPEINEKPDTPQVHAIAQELLEDFE